MESKKLEGIGGWLLIPTFAFVVTAIIFVYLSGSLLIDLSIEYDETLFILFWIYSFISCSYIYALILEFKKKKNFPRIAIAILWISYILMLLAELVVDGTISSYSGIIGLALWTAYLIKSERVKNTFIK